ncbi:hypothetical protein TSOC_008112 [Tetrabaena socialis]|uniref:Uncharacterized protein n=1 Tax=Tetrabaena socialis TaxID=47790 RepID=A0A2J7ZZC3_9CHLO|nr:hypothetical protein TSOC_008112 [Tetrabaena socialis]|eukprot:PNH05598.1 hypothetical protein TSOC_008112 [Tetrabaena socialis]
MQDDDDEVSKKARPRPVVIQRWLSLAGATLFATVVLIGLARVHKHDTIFVSLGAYRDKVCLSTGGARLWTHGWTFYTPDRNVIFHHYGRKDSPKFWNDFGGDASYHRTKAANLQKVIALMNGTYDTSYTYGMGRHRSVRQWWQYAGMDPANQTMVADGNKFCWSTRYERLHLNNSQGKGPNLSRFHGASMYNRQTYLMQARARVARQGCGAEGRRAAQRDAGRTAAVPRTKGTWKAGG